MKIKTKSNLLITILTLATIMGFLGFTVGTVSANSEPIIIEVYPSGDPTVDTPNIQAAFDIAVAAGPGSTVQLNQGTFFLNAPIVVANFDGYFKGKGKDKTVINTTYDSPFPLIKSGPYQGTSGSPGTFFFYQDSNWPDGVSSSLRFSDMTIRLRGKPEPWRSHGLPWDWESWNIFEIHGKHTGVEDFEPSYFDVSAKRMGFEGEVGDFIRYGVNALNGFGFAGEAIYEIDEQGSFLFKYMKPIIGTYTITDCTFKNIVFASGAFYLQDSNLIAKRNTFKNVGFGIRTTDLNNTNVKTSHNDFSDIWYIGIDINQAWQSTRGWDFGPYGDSPEPGTVIISHNTIHCPGNADGIGLVDWASLFGAGKRLDAIVFKNEIILDNTEYGGIWGYGAQDVLVLNNRITGTGLAGIYMGAFGDYVSGWEIIGNDVQDVTAYVAPILLGPGTSNCLVIGWNTEETVLDLGTDNTIIDFPYGLH